MKYNAPYGSADPNAPYVDRNMAAATKGSIPPAAAIEFPQREIMAVITAAGISGSNGDLTQLYQAIQQLILAATGGGDTSNYVLMPAARARLPIFPEVLTSDGRIPISAPSTGTVRVPAGYDFLHRGIFAITTVQTDFVTVANKTYHLRWNPTNGFQLKDLADVAYNPAAVAETDISFDSAYDNMLVARVVTSAGNVATIANLANKERLQVIFEKTTWEQNSVTYPPAPQVTINFARTPLHRFLAASIEVTLVEDQVTGWLNQEARNRYTAKPIIAGTSSSNYINGTHTVVFEA
ncbi:hypothetical protein [Rhizobium leguminosarum]|uniref:hypothetical protein n=1 Tax=Rhizobium leguminosarum TaxID=384 RepID=UPI001C90CAB8|nr:hypothetical protein [Rhizobium leguminosarum]MBY2918856.1 hypothetical protein [Rhizobium leguminosarum]MBY2974549.1 hypothetical protein [Rhizobium leguminosarum]MBY2981986.1 hypothetical protein [Rhizobium leguminosarum]MBY3010498.1 hypothetical protein [Rhizobium leguminosarum]